MAKSRQSLNLDLDTLFPGESLTIGNTQIIIRPLGFEQIAILIKQLEGIGELLTAKEITWENYNTHKNLFKLAVVLMDNFPSVLEEASNIDINDLKPLPLEVIVQIVETVIAVNLKSKDTLEKNFESLAKNFLPVKTEDKVQAPKKSQKK